MTRLYLILPNGWMNSQLGDENCLDEASAALLNLQCVFMKLDVGIGEVWPYYGVPSDIQPLTSGVFVPATLETARQTIDATNTVPVVIAKPPVG